MSLDIQRENYVNDLLRDSKIVHAVGPRPSKSRAFYTFLALSAVSIVLGSALNFVGNAKFSYKNDNVTSTPITAPSAPLMVQLGDDKSTAIFNAILVDERSEGAVPSFKDFKHLMEEQNISAIQARNIYIHLDEAQSTYVLGRNNPILAESLSARQQISKIYLDRLWNSESPDKLDIKTSFIQEKLEVDHGRGWAGASDRDIWSDIENHWDKSVFMVGLPYEDFSYLPSVNDDMSIEEARELLKISVSQAGIMSIKVPMQVMNNASMLQQLSKTIDKANLELQEITGFDGGVLGLNYRAIMDLTAVDQSATVFLNSMGYINVYAWWPTLAHEWFHMYDLALSGVIDKGTVFSTSSAQVQVNDPKWLSSKVAIDNKKDPNNMRQGLVNLWVGINNPNLSQNELKSITLENKNRYESIYPGAEKPTEDTENQLEFSENKTLLDVLVETDRKIAVSQDKISGSPWIYWRKSAAELGKSINNGYGKTVEDYLLEPAEIMAFSFGAHASEFQIQKLKVSYPNANAQGEDIFEQGIVLHDDLYQNNITYVPTLVEIRATMSMWQGYFGSSQNWWVDDQNQRMSTPEVINVFSSYGKIPNISTTVILERGKTRLEQKNSQSEDTSIKLSF